jgi:ketosteroid isomerase-like protein
VSHSQQPNKLSDNDVRRLVQDWYDALDRHDPVEAILPYLVTEGLVMRFPEGTLRGVDDFRGWYETVTRKFFDEVHDLKKVEVRPTGPTTAVVLVVVNWQARVWNPPAAHSVWIGFDATQTWTVASEGGAARIRNYDVDELAPMPGSAALDET